MYDDIIPAPDRASIESFVREIIGEKPSVQLKFRSKETTLREWQQQFWYYYYKILSAVFCGDIKINEDLDRIIDERMKGGFIPFSIDRQSFENWLQDNNEKKLPLYSDKESEFYAPILTVALAAHKAVAGTDIAGYKNPSDALESWITNNKDEYNFKGQNVITDAVKAANWKPGGGRPSKKAK